MIINYKYWISTIPPGFIFVTGWHGFIFVCPRITPWLHVRVLLASPRLHFHFIPSQGARQEWNEHEEARVGRRIDTRTKLNRFSLRILVHFGHQGKCARIFGEVRLSSVRVFMRPVGNLFRRDWRDEARMKWTWNQREARKKRTVMKWMVNSKSYNDK